MKRSLIVAALVVSSSTGFAGGAQAQGVAADLLPPYEVSTIVTSMGMRPIGRPIWRGDRYVLLAIDRYGREVRVVLDARDGQVLAVRPLAGAYGQPQYGQPQYGQQQYGYDPRYAPPPPPGYPRGGPAPYDPRFGPAPAPGAAPGAPPPSDGDEDYFDNDRQQGSLPRPSAPFRTAAVPPRDVPTGSVPRRVTSLSPKDSAAKDATPMPRPRPAHAKLHDQKAGNPKPSAPQVAPSAAPASQNGDKPAAQVPAGNPGHPRNRVEGRTESPGFRFRQEGCSRHRHRQGYRQGYWQAGSEGRAEARRSDPILGTCIELRSATERIAVAHTSKRKRPPPG